MEAPKPLRLWQTTLLKLRNGEKRSGGNFKNARLYNPTTGGGAAASPLHQEGHHVGCHPEKENEKVLIGDNVTVMVVEIQGKQIKLGIEAPDDVLILREKLAKKEEA